MGKRGEMKKKRNELTGKTINIILCCLLLCLLPAAESAGLEFNSTRSLTAGFPGDQPGGPRVAYNSRRNEYLVVYEYHNDIMQGSSQIHAARLSADGKYIANYIISDLPNNCMQPDVDYDPVNDRYLVVWSYDRLGNNGDKDVYGRFVPATGPVDNLPGMTIGGFSTWHESYPRLAYGAIDQDFFVVFNLETGGANQPGIAGFRVPADGSPSWHYMSIHEDTYQGPRMHPDIAYNPVRDEFMVVYDNAEDIYGHIFPGHSTYGQFYNITDIGLAMTELPAPATPLPGIHDFPAISFSPGANYYMITWDSNRAAGHGDIYARYYPGGNTLPATVYMELLDNSADHDRNSSVACKNDGTGCLALWIVKHNGALFTFGREISLKSDATGALISHDTGFYAPLDNLGPASSWSRYPTVAIAGGRKNFYLGFMGKRSNITNIFGRNTIFTSFSWPMFLPAIIHGKK